jgi:hypothetical protein
MLYRAAYVFSERDEGLLVMSKLRESVNLIAMMDSEKPRCIKGGCDELTHMLPHF